MTDDNIKNEPAQINDDTDLTRRDLIKLGAGAAITATLLGMEPTALAAQGKSPLFFTREEFALLDELTELIIPADDHSPGARAAQVASYIDFRLSESFEEGPKS